MQRTLLKSILCKKTQSRRVRAWLCPSQLNGSRTLVADATISRGLPQPNLQLLSTQTTSQQNEGLAGSGKLVYAVVEAVW